MTHSKLRKIPSFAVAGSGGTELLQFVSCHKGAQYPQQIDNPDQGSVKYVTNCHQHESNFVFLSADVAYLAGNFLHFLLLFQIKEQFK